MEERHVRPETDQPTGESLDDAKIERERAIEQQEGITRDRRGSEAAPSDRAENAPPHPQDINDIAR